MEESIRDIIWGIRLAFALVDGNTTYGKTAGLRAVICNLRPTKYAVLTNRPRRPVTAQKCHEF